MTALTESRQTALEQESAEIKAEMIYKRFDMRI